MHHGEEMRHTTGPPWRVFEGLPKGPVPQSPPRSRGWVQTKYTTSERKTVLESSKRAWAWRCHGLGVWFSENQWSATMRRRNL